MSDSITSTKTLYLKRGKGFKWRLKSLIQFNHHIKAIKLVIQMVFLVISEYCNQEKCQLTSNTHSNGRENMN